MEISYRGDSTYVVVVMIMYSFNGFLYRYILTFIPANVPTHMVGPVFFSFSWIFCFLIWIFHR